MDATSRIQSPPTSTQEKPAPRAWAAAGVLSLAALFCSADLALPALLVEPIKAAFRLQDTQIALLTGFSFAASMSVFALPLSWLADRWNRAVLLTIAIAVWCALTVGSGFATGFWSLFVLRLGVGLGEAALAPASYSLMADLFPSKTLPKPLGAFAIATMLGSVLALSGGGALYEALRRAGESHALPIAASDAWRWTTAAFGGAGLLVAATAGLVLREPRLRSTRTAIAVSKGEGLPLARFVRASWFFFLPYVLALIAFVMWRAGFMSWIAPFFSRTYGWSIGRIGQTVGLLNLLAGLLGAPLGVWMSERLRARRGRDAPVAVTWIALAVTAPVLAVAPLAPNGWLAAAAFAVMFVAAGAASVVTPMVFTTTAPPHLRARMLALFGLCYGLIGQGAGAVVFAEFTERLAGGPTHLRITMSAMSAILMFVCVAFLIVSDRRYPAAHDLALASSPST